MEGRDGGKKRKCWREAVIPLSPPSPHHSGASRHSTERLAPAHPRHARRGLWETKLGQCVSRLISVINASSRSCIRFTTFRFLQSSFNALPITIVVDTDKTNIQTRLRIKEITLSFEIRPIFLQYKFLGLCITTTIFIRASSIISNNLHVGLLSCS